MSAFPENVIDLLVEFASQLDGVSLVVARSLNMTDPNGCVGLDADEWVADEVEMGPTMGLEPTLSTYVINIQHMVKHADAIEGARLHREVAKSIRVMLYRNADLAVRFQGLVEDGERRERMLKWQVLGQRFASNDIQGIFTSMSATEFAFQTETSTSS
jgi:hypothetical protein